MKQIYEALADNLAVVGSGFLSHSAPAPYPTHTSVNKNHDNPSDPCNSQLLYAKSLLKIGNTRHDCEQLLNQYNLASISFAQWLAIPALQCLLVFEHDRCVAIDYQLINFKLS